MHFWLDVARVKGRRSFPVNTSLNGPIPALVPMSVGSFCGTSGADGQNVWPLPLKKSRNDARTSEAVLDMTPRLLALFEDFEAGGGRLRQLLRQLLRQARQLVAHRPNSALYGAAN